MRFSRVYIACVVLFLLVVFLAEYRVPQKFRWEPTYSRTDRQPFGCYVLDSVLRASLPHGYSVTRKTLYQLQQEKQKTPRGILVVADRQWLSETDVRALLGLARRGNSILLAGPSVDDTLHYTLDYRYTGLTLLKYVQKHHERDTVLWAADSIYGERAFLIYLQVVEYSLTFRVKKAARHYTLATRRLWTEEPADDVVFSADGNEADSYEYEVMAAEFPVGKGKIIVVPTPLVFTNYTMLDGDNHDYIFRLLSHMGPLPVVRTEAYGPAVAEAEQTPLRYILSQRPLRWALYTALLGVVLMMLTTARRRQRVIPVMSNPQNHTLEFVQLIGTLYYQRRDYRDLVLKKFSYMAETLRRELHIDITDATDDDRSIALLTRQTGTDAASLRQLIVELRLLQVHDAPLTPRQMSHYLHQMNDIIQKL